MDDFLDSIDPDNIPQRFMPELRSINFSYDEISRCFHFQPYPVDCDVVLCDATDVRDFDILVDKDGEAICHLDNFLAISPAAGVIWLRRLSPSRPRLRVLAVWGDPSQLCISSDLPDIVDYLARAKAAQLDQ